jgi:TolB-like protein/DNA-binding winged helix-turn-helix (wHTH) protein
MPPVVHTFAGYLLDPGRRTLTSPDGIDVKLTGKAFDALGYLVEHAGQVVDRTTLIQALWPKRVVEDNNLNQAIAAIRRAIGDEHIVTVAGRGYQLVTPVTSRTVGIKEHPHARHQWWSRFAAAVVAGLAVVAIGNRLVRDPAPERSSPSSIAVLPLENLSPDPERAYIAWGLQEAIIGRLFDFGFDVRPRGAVRQYVPSKRPGLGKIARDLDVDAIMEGTVRYADDRLRITLTLVTTVDGRTLWHETFEREYADLFAIESEVARNVAEALEATLTPQQLAVADDDYEPNPIAYDLYLTGMDHERRGIYKSDFVIAQYERATEIDPEFALPWVRLALAKLRKRRWIDRNDPSLMPSAREAAERALKVAPDLTLANLALAYHAWLEGADHREILRDLNAVEGKAQRIPEFFAIRANIYGELGLWEEHLADLARVVMLEPRHIPFLLGNGEANVLLRRYDEAQALFDRARDLEPDDLGMLLHRANLAVVRDGDPEPLRQLEARVLSGDLPPPPIALAALYADDYDTAVRLLSILPEAPRGTDGHYRRPLLLAQALGYAGRDDEARPLFTTALERIGAQLATAPPARRPELEIAFGAAWVGLGEPATAIEHASAALHELHLLPALAAVGRRMDAILVLASAGDVESTVVELERYLSSPGQWSLEGMLPHPAFDGIRTDSRFMALVSRHAPSGVDDDCAICNDAGSQIGARALP